MLTFLQLGWYVSGFDIFTDEMVWLSLWNWHNWNCLTKVVTFPQLGRFYSGLIFPSLVVTFYNWDGFADLSTIPFHPYPNKSCTRWRNSHPSYESVWSPLAHSIKSADSDRDWLFRAGGTNSWLLSKKSKNKETNICLTNMLKSLDV